MRIRKFQGDKDLQLLEIYLRNQYLINKKLSFWLPERLHDLIYRVGPHEADGGRERSLDYIFLWEERGEVIACILPDGENIYISIKNGFESLFRSILAYSEENCLPLFHKADDGSVKFWVAANDRLGYMQEILLASGYARYGEGSSIMPQALPRKAASAFGTKPFPKNKKSSFVDRYLLKIGRPPQRSADFQQISLKKAPFTQGSFLLRLYHT